MPKMKVKIAEPKVEETKADAPENTGKEQQGEGDKK